MEAKIINSRHIRVTNQLIINDTPYMNEGKLTKTPTISEGNEKGVKDEKDTMAMDDLRKEKNSSKFENVEVKKMSELPYWNKMAKFLTDKKIAHREVIVVNDEEKWKSIYGSNDSKSSHKPTAIILKKEIFEDENISDENMSWLIHEIGHVEFYNGLGDKLDEYMDNYHADGGYANSAMEKAAFHLQFEFLKSIGKTKAECLNFIENYLGKSFNENEEVESKKELEQIKRYLDNIY